MIRWLKIARAELVRDIKTSIRYPLELATGVFILYVLFMGLFMGAKLLAGQKALSGNLDGVVIGYSMWFFAIIAINTMSVDTENEARQGTLEQVYLHAPHYVGLLWIRAATHLALGAGLVCLLSILLQASTGHWLSLTWAKLLPMLFVIATTLVGLCGVGIVLGGLSLLFKRIGQLSALVQFSLFFLAYVELSAIAEPWRSFIAHLPLARGVDLLKTILSPQSQAVGVDIGLAWLALDSLIYALVGTMLFVLMERAARRQGLLSHY